MQVTNGGSFTWDGGYSSCPGSAWDGVTGGTGSPVSIEVSAGDAGCAEAAQWLQQRTDTVLGTNGDTNGWPSELAFAFSGTLTIDGNDFEVAIGQSPSNGTWWVGGKGWDSTRTGVCTGQVFVDEQLVQYSLNQMAGPPSYMVSEAGRLCD